MVAALLLRDIFRLALSLKLEVPWLYKRANTQYSYSLDLNFTNLDIPWVTGSSRGHCKGKSSAGGAGSENKIPYHDHVILSSA